MTQPDERAAWMLPWKRFVQAIDPAAFPGFVPAALRPAPGWYRGLGALLVVLALLQGVRMLDRALIDRMPEGPDPAAADRLDAREWIAWSARIGWTGVDGTDGFDASTGAAEAAFAGGPDGVILPAASVPEMAAQLVPAAGFEAITAAHTPATSWVSTQVLGEKARMHRFVRIEVTGYSSRVSETDDTPFITANNTLVEPGTIALSRDLLRTFTPNAPFDFGDKVLIPGVGIFDVHDTMHPRWEMRADIWFEATERALAFGRRNVWITGVDENAPTVAYRHQ